MDISQEGMHCLKGGKQAALKSVSP